MSTPFPSVRRFVFVAFSLLTLLAVGCSAGSSTTSGSSSGATPNRPSSVPSSPVASGGGQVSGKQWPTEPAMTIDANKSYKATISTTMGDMEAELFPKEAPRTVNNFVFLAREGYYENVKFHRIMKDFMVQTGDPTGTGAGSPGYKFVDELPTTLNYDKGTLAMANSGPNTNGSQFFVVHGDNVSSMLPKSYSIFGRLTKGIDVLDRIATVEVRPSPRGERSVPTTDVLIKSVTISEQ
jgi:cyclophilin family peptidyl-prolyl cis-trans isomerase